MCDRQLSRFATLVLPLSVVGVPAHSQTIYVADACTNKIQRVDPGGSDAEDLVVRELGAPTALVVDPLEGKIYWADTESRWRKIRRANLDGSGIEDVVEMDARRPDDLAIDPAGRRLYWVASGPGDDCRLQRSNLDGTAIETVRDLPRPVFSLALDAVNGKLYWVDSLGELIRRANLDGSEGEDVIATGMDFVEDLTIDPAGGKAYWCGANYGVSGGHVRRANLDGSDAEELLTLDFWPRGGIQVDSKAGKLYWTTQSDVHRANLDGSDVEHLVHVQWGAAARLGARRVCGENVLGEREVRFRGTFQDSTSDARRHWCGGRGCDRRIPARGDYA